MVGSGTSDDHLAGYLQCNLLRGGCRNRRAGTASPGDGRGHGAVVSTRQKSFERPALVCCIAGGCGHGPHAVVFCRWMAIFQRGALPDRDVWRAESGQIHDEGHLSHQHETVRWLSQWVRRALGAQLVIFAGLTPLLVWQNHSLSPASFVIKSFCYSMDFVVDGTSRVAGDAASVGRVDTAYLLRWVAEQSLRVFAGGLTMLESMPLLRPVGQVHWTCLDVPGDGICAGARSSRDAFEVAGSTLFCSSVCRYVADD